MGEVEVESQKSHSTSTLASPQPLKPPLQTQNLFSKAENLTKTSLANQNPFATTENTPKPSFANEKELSTTKTNLATNTPISLARKNRQK